MDSLRRLLSLMEPASTKFSSLKDANVEQPSGDDVATNSLAYFQATQSLLKDLRQKAGSYNSDAFWIDMYSTKIDKLPILLPMIVRRRAPSRLHLVTFATTVGAGNNFPY